MDDEIEDKSVGNPPRTIQKLLLKTDEHALLAQPNTVKRTKPA